MNGKLILGCIIGIIWAGLVTLLEYPNITGLPIVALSVGFCMSAHIDAMQDGGG